MKVAVIQMNAGSDKQRNIGKAISFVKKAAQNGAQWICLPEVFHYRGPVDLQKIANEIAESIPGESTAPLSEIARQKKVFILAGSIFEKAPATKKAYNTSVVFDDHGYILGKYSKMNLFEAQLGNRTIRESKNFLPGKKIVSVRVKEFTVGLSICYDLRFPQMYQEYRKRGCQVFTAPSAFTQKTGKAHWEILARCRAVENLCYLLGPNQVGADERGIAAFGNSLIVGPWGEILARGSDDKEEILYADISLAEVKKARRRLPGIVKN